MSIKAPIKTKPVLKAELAGDFNGMPLKLWTSWRHDAMVMFSWQFMKIHENSWKFMDCHENMTLASWRHALHNFKRIPLKLPANFTFKTRFVFIGAFLTMKYWQFHFSVRHIRQRARACSVMEGGSFEGSLKKILKELDKK